MEAASTYWLTRFCFQRALAVIYGLGFLIALNQFRALCGRSGLLPLQLFLNKVGFWDAPSLFWINQSDGFITGLAALGLALSVFAFAGYSDAFGTALSVCTWVLLWLLYMSFVNVGQAFYGFGWESLLLETGFLAIFMGSSASQPSMIPIYLLRWLLFRVMFGAGVIKLRGDECWRNLTCMQYHYETMPLPGPASWYFHHLSKFVQKISVLFNHFVELVIPFFYFGPRRFAIGAGLLTVIFQLVIVASGNFSWLNHLTIVIAIACLDDSVLSKLGPWLTSWAKYMGVGGLDPNAAAIAGFPAPVIYALAVLIAVLSIKPALNLISSRQIMNTSFDPFHIVNTYGAFGSITRTRNEVILEGANSREGPWSEYGFKAKPGDVARMPPLVSPYHYKLDWQMWFAAMSPYYYHPWILNLEAKLLAGDRPVLGLLGSNPFPKAPPKYIKASLYEYHFTSPGEANWWKREYKGEYLPPLSLDDPQFKQILRQQGWSVR
jgi:hypothetical protein